MSAAKSIHTTQQLLKLLLPCLLLLQGCPRSDLGETLFEITFPPVEFVIPAGQPSFQTFVVAQPRVVTDFLATLDARSFTPEDVDAVGGRRARIVSLGGEDFREIERIELRVCSASEFGCSQIDIMFSISDLTGRRQTSVRSQPRPSQLSPPLPRGGTSTGRARHLPQQRHQSDHRGEARLGGTGGGGAVIYGVATEGSIRPTGGWRISLRS